MHHVNRVLVVLGLVGIGAVGLAAQTAEMKRDEQEISNYRLNMDVLKRLVEVYKGMSTLMAADPRTQKLAQMTAELQALQEKEEPTEAENARMEQLAQDIERLDEEGDGEKADWSNAKTLSEMARAVDAHPQIASVVKKAGFTSREFATAQLALFQAGMVAGMMKAGGIKEMPTGGPGENVNFILDHYEEFEAMTATLKKN